VTPIRDSPVDLTPEWRLLSIAIITGTTSGLGLALLEQLYGKVDCLHCFNRRHDPELAERFPAAQFHVLNIAAMNEVRDSLEPILKGVQGPTYVFLNAGINLVDNERTFSHERFHEVIETNLSGCSTFISALESNLGSKAKIICIGSTATLFPNLGHAGYFVSKVALHGLVKVLQRSKTHHQYKLVILGPMMSRMGRNAEVAGFKRRVFEFLAVSPQRAAAKILKFSAGNRRVLRLTWTSYFFFGALSLIYGTWFRLRSAFAFSSQS
jgi:NAD(P)-dependent dehydrogenase (short-subunit alcohol dehydrogenase family)